jgi:PAS domain S-box-containing protein
MNVDEEHVRDAYNAELRNVLSTVAAGLAALYGVLSVVHSLSRPMGDGLIMFSFSLISASFFGIAAFWFRRHPVSSNISHLTAVGMIGIAYANSTVSVVLSHGIAHRSDYLILVLGASLLFFSLPYLLIVIGATAVTWLAIAWRVDPSPDSVHFGFALVVASGVAVLTQRLRVQSFRRMILLQREVERQRSDLASTNRILAASEERFRRFADIAVEGIAFHEHGQIFKLNERFAAIFGYSVTELVGRQLADLIAPSDLDRFRNTLALASDSPDRFIGVRKDGTRVLVEIVGRCVAFDNRNLQLTAVRDVTEQVRLAKERDRLFDLSLDMLCIADSTGHFVRVNPAWTDTTGFDRDELIARPYIEFVHPDDRERTVAETSRWMAGETTTQFQNRFLCKDGSYRTFAWTARPYTSEGLVFAVARDITARQRELDELRYVLTGVRGLLWYANVTNHDGVFDWDIHVSDAEAAQRFLPLDVQSNQTYEQAWYESKLPEYRAHMDEVAVGALLREQTHYSQEYPCRRNDGRIQWLYEDVRVLSAGENRWQLIGVCTDVTDIKRVERALRESEEQFRTVFDNAPIGMAIVSPEGRLTRVNRELSRILGYRPREMLAMPFLDYSHPSDSKRESELFAQLVSRDLDSFRIEKRAVTKEGRVVWVNVTVFPVFSSLGELQFFVRMVEDITERKRALDALRESEERYRDLFENATDLIQSVRPDGTFAYVNRSWMQTLGYTSDDVARLHLMDVIHPECRPECEKLFRRVMAGESVDTIQTDFVTSRGERITVEGSVSCRFENGAPSASRAILRDITERKQLDRLKDEFVSTVSHELRTPLTSIFGSLGLLVGGAAGPLPETIQRMLRIAYTNSERLIRLVNDILDMQKIESGRMEFHLEPLEIAPLVVESVEANRAYAARFKVAYQVEDEAHGAKARVDRDRLLQVLANLLSNAAKFTTPDTTVTVRVEASDAVVRVAVTDHGPGIPAEFRNRIFAKFAQADSSDSRQKGGTGLGLSIAKAIVERLGGEIGYESVVGEGMTFTFTLPRCREQFLTTDADRLGTRRGRLLVCEDDPDVAAVMTALLENAGYLSEVVPTIAHAKERVATGAYDALVLDLILPDASGVSLLSWLRQQEKTRTLPVIVVSVIADEEKKHLDGTAFEVVDWINKPFDPARLLNAVALATRSDKRRRPQILHVEDDVDVLHVVAAVLNVADVTFATTLKEAREKLGEVVYDLVILDVVLPDGSGLDLLPVLTRSDVATPVVIFSAHEVSLEMAGKVHATLVKSRTSNTQLVTLIDALLAKRLSPTGIVAAGSE